jgi:alpha-glucosidase
MTVNPKWWQTGVIYQIYPRSFMDSNNDGIGDLPGVMSKLDYLQWLGVDAIWFSPTFPSPMADFGYDVADYRDVHPDFGTLDDFDRLLAAAKERGIGIVLDLVPNHTSSQHEWFLESRSSRENPKRDWYIWKDPKPDGSPPNNWLSFFGGSAWEFDDTTGQYYLHNFLKEQPDLNWRNPEVKAAMFDAIRFWLKKGVAGFRVDVIDVMLKDEQFRDNPPDPNFNPATDPSQTQFLHVYNGYQDEVHDLIREMRSVFEEFEDRVFIGEIGYGISIEKAVSYHGKNHDELLLPFNFEPVEMTRYGSVPTAEALQAYINAYDAAVGVDNQPNWVWGNHDMPRVASRVGERRRLFAMMQLTLRGTPFIYYGEELGMENVDIPPEKEQDPFGINIPGQGRDHCRTPMQWSAEPNAGFTAPDVEPWLPLAPDYETVNVERQRTDGHSMLTLYHKLLMLRRSMTALNHGLYYPIPNPPEGLIAYARQFNDQRLVIVLNFTDEKREVSIAGHRNGHVILSTALDRDEDADLTALALRPYEGVIVEIPAGTQSVPRVQIAE